MADTGRWVTIKGRRVFIEEGETPTQAIERSKKEQTKGMIKGYTKDAGLKHKIGTKYIGYDGEEYEIKSFIPKDGEVYYNVGKVGSGVGMMYHPDSLDPIIDKGLTKEKVDKIKEEEAWRKSYVDKKRKERAEREQKQKEAIADYLKEYSGIKKERIRSTLSKTITYEGKSMTRGEFIRSKIENGSEAEAYKYKGKDSYRIWENDKKSFFDITKIEYDFAEYLSQSASKIDLDELFGRKR